MILNLTIELDATDEAAFNALPERDRPAFGIAKLAARLAPKLLASLSHSDVLAALQPADQQAIGSLISAIKAMP